MEMFGDYPQNITWKRYSFPNHPYEKYQSNSADPWRIQAEGMAPQSLEVKVIGLIGKLRKVYPKYVWYNHLPTYLPTYCILSCNVSSCKNALIFDHHNQKKTSKLFQKSLINDSPHLFLKKPTNPTKNLSPFSPSWDFWRSSKLAPPNNCFSFAAPALRLKGKGRCASAPREIYIYILIQANLQTTVVKKPSMWKIIFVGIK